MAVTILKRRQNLTEKTIWIRRAGVMRPGPGRLNASQEDSNVMASDDANRWSTTFCEPRATERASRTTKRCGTPMDPETR
jgi:hypothetical protein